MVRTWVASTVLGLTDSMGRIIKRQAKKSINQLRVSIFSELRWPHTIKSRKEKKQHKPRLTDTIGVKSWTRLKEPLNECTFFIKWGNAHSDSFGLLDWTKLQRISRTVESYGYSQNPRVSSSRLPYRLPSATKFTINSFNFYALLFNPPIKKQHL